MQARSISSIRRTELSQAAFEAVIRYGLRGTTLEKVGEIAGVSKGVVLHHFKDKSALLEAVFRRSNSVLNLYCVFIGTLKVHMKDFGPLLTQTFQKQFTIGKSAKPGYLS